MDCEERAAAVDVKRLAKSEQRARNAIEGHPCGRPSIEKMSGGVLLSHSLSGAVPSALNGLTSGFGMGPGVSRSLWPP